MTTSAPWHNPDPRSPYHLLIVGAGPAGLMAAQVAVRRGARVALIERNRLGACLHTGSIPSKTIIRTSRLYREMRDAEHFGARVPAGIAVDFPRRSFSPTLWRATGSRFTSTRRPPGCGSRATTGSQTWSTMA